jgi:hypothetical protein
MAEEDADGGQFLGKLHVTVEVVHVHLHLAEVLMGKCGEPGCFVGPGSRWFVGIGGVEAGWSVGWEAC